MTNAASMIESAPAEIGFPEELLVRCINACFDCAQTCTACADACLAEEMVAELRHCITTDLNCADLCAAAGAVLSRQTSYDHVVTRAALEACRAACVRCAAECAQHSEMHEHCRICAEACRMCEQACAALLDAGS